jgi:thioredoxin-like negative regulator of GroEL
MRVTLTDSALARYAGRFVWLELNFDSPANQEFLMVHAVSYTPSFYILDPTDEHPLATQLGAMNLRELLAFLERGETSFLAKVKSPQDIKLQKGDELLNRGHFTEAAELFGEALKEGARDWPERDNAIASYTWSLMLSNQSQQCAETAIDEAPGMNRGGVFGRVVLSGLNCINQVDPTPWADAALQQIQPLAAEAIALPATVRDHRYQIYQQLMSAAKTRGDAVNVKKWGDLWLKELDSTTPANDDERSALDIARVDAASLLGDPLRVLPALTASARAMPTNYNASLRLAQMEIDARRYDEAIASCNHGLAHVTGPIGRTWLLQVKADALIHETHLSAAHRVLESALSAARAIGVKQTRDRNVAKVQKTLAEIEQRNGQSH